VIDIQDEFGVQRTRYQSTEIETVNLATFLFGFRDAQGFEHRVSSRRMKISGNEKATLFGFLKSLLGHAPQYGWDYMAVKGQQCLLTVEHIQRRDGTGIFAGIAALSPVPSSMGAGPQARLAVQPVAGARPAVVPVRPPVRPAAPSAGSGQVRPGAPSVAPANDPIPF
jgi:hypothetical protein